MKILLLSSMLFVLALTQVSAQDTTVTVKTLIYKTVATTELKMFMFYGEGSQRKSDNVAIAFFHGGGWVFGSPSEFFEACKRFARMGYITFSVDYRLCKNADGTYP